MKEIQRTVGDVRLFVVQTERGAEEDALSLCGGVALEALKFTVKPHHLPQRS